MTRMNPKPKGMHRSIKFMLAACASTATLSGWAWLTITAPPPILDAEETDLTEVAMVVPTQQPLNRLQVSLDAAPKNTNVLRTVDATLLPPSVNLAQLPVRGLRYVGDSKPTVNLPVPTTVVVPQVQAPPQAAADPNQGQANAPKAQAPQAQASQAQAPQPAQAKAPAPAPAPKPKHKTKSSK